MATVPMTNLAPNPYASTGNGLNPFGIALDDKHFAEKTEAAQLRSNWDSTRADLMPLVNRMSAMYTNPNGREEMVQNAANLNAGAAARSGRSFTRQMDANGLQLTDAQKGSFQSSSNLNAGLADVSARNTASRGYDRLREQIGLG